MTAGTETPDAETTPRTRVVTKRSDPAVPTEGVLKRMRIWSKHSRPLTPAVVSEQPEKRARIPETPASVNPETFAMMLESDGSLETCTELNAVALDLHEPDPETMWSSQTCRMTARKRSRNCRNLKRTKRSNRVRPRDRKSSVHGLSTKWEESGELRSRLVSRGYESSRVDPASLFAATPSVVATRIALVLGLAQDVEMAVADISGAFLHVVLEKHFFCHATS